jgi:hypothetical protein
MRKFWRSDQFGQPFTTEAQRAQRKPQIKRSTGFQELPDYVVGSGRMVEYTQFVALPGFKGSHYPGSPQAHNTTDRYGCGVPCRAARGTWRSAWCSFINVAIESVLRGPAVFREFEKKFSPVAPVGNVSRVSGRGKSYYFLISRAATSLPADKL